MCKMCAADGPFKLFVIVLECCCKVEPMAAARAVSSPVVLVVHTDIPHELQTHRFLFVVFQITRKLFI